jgi:hypothetical protein
MPLTPHALAVLLTATLVAVLAPLGPARAQTPGAYVQIEAHRDPVTARERAADWASDLPGISVFALPSGWSAIALGPYGTEAAARAALVELRAARRIPGDSYLTAATDYDRRIGGAGGMPPSLATALPEADPPEAVTAPAPEPAPEPEPEPATETLAEARAAERALDRPAREDIQRALAWFGHYPGTIDAAFGPGTRRAIAAWQAAARQPETGVLRSAERTALLDAWQAERDRLGLEEVTEAEAGIRVALPLGLVRRAGTEPPFVRYEGVDNGTVILLLSQPGDALTLRAFYDIFQSLEAMPSDGPRRIDADAFAIEGRADGRTATAAAELEDGWVKGWLVAWPRAEDATMARALPALRDSFTALDGGLPRATGPAPGDDLLGGVALRRPLRAASGVFVAAIRVELDQRGPVARAWASRSAASRSVARVPPPFTAAMRSATQAWKQCVGPSIAGLKRPPSNPAAKRPRCMPSTTPISSMKTLSTAVGVAGAQPGSVSAGVVEVDMFHACGHGPRLQDDGEGVVAVHAEQHVGIERDIFRAFVPLGQVPRNRGRPFRRAAQLAIDQRALARIPPGASIW